MMNHEGEKTLEKSDLTNKEIMEKYKLISSLKRIVFALINF